jgi:hypothetical protein
MLEIAGGILLAVVILVFVLANFGRIVIGLSAIFAVGIVIASAVFIFSLPTDYRNAILIVLLAAAAFSAFAYWTHADKRFHLPGEKRSEDK